MSSRYIILTGAPLVEDLDWTEASLDQASISDNTTWHPSSSIASDHSDALGTTRWRAIRVSTNIAEGRHAIDVPGSDYQEEHTFYNKYLKDSIFQGVDESETFLERFEDTELSPKRLVTLDESFADNSEGQSFLSAPTTSGSFEGNSDVTAVLESTRNATNSTFTDLRRLPDHAYITQLAPQTVTVDLLVAVIVVRPTKNVQLRRKAGQMDIVELVVGDETRAGFGVTIWLAPEGQRQEVLGDLRHITSSLHHGDLLMINNLALSAYQNIVYGQTLSTKYTRSSTTFTKLAKSAAASAESGKKLRRVFEWSARFLGGQECGHRNRQKLLPPDSQSSSNRE